MVQFQASSKLPRLRRDPPEGMEIPWGVGVMTSTAGIPRANGVTRSRSSPRVLLFTAQGLIKLNIQLNLCEQRCHAPSGAILSGKPDSCRARPVSIL